MLNQDYFTVYVEFYGRSFAVVAPRAWNYVP